MTSSVYRGHKAVMKQTEETMKTDIVVPSLILHWTYDNYLFAILKFFFISLAHFLNSFSMGLGRNNIEIKCKK